MFLQPSRSWVDRGVDPTVDRSHIITSISHNLRSSIASMIAGGTGGENSVSEVLQLCCGDSFSHCVF